MTSEDIPNPQKQLNWFIGTIGFGYDDWRGSFYPPQTKPRNYLTHYSRIFNAVEIDSTFHAVPAPGVLERWGEMTPAEFRFALKMSKQVTHAPELSYNRQLLAGFFSVSRALGSKLGPILLQFPPSFRLDKIDQLRQFLASLPTDLRFAVEVRHQSWYTRQGDEPRALAVLLKEFGICWAATQFPGLPGEVTTTTDFLMVRWIGQNGSFMHHNREQVDRTAELTAWGERIRSSTLELHDIYGFFNNDYSGFPPQTANRFKKIIGLPVQEFDLPRQATFF
jgi:uncharacterized protein YecE (DUF72 family)